MKTFEKIKHLDEQGNEYWRGRELKDALKYYKWQDLHKCIKRACEKCTKNGEDVFFHFVSDPVRTKGRISQDYKLTRYACYLVSMEASPKKQQVLSARSFFGNDAPEVAHVHAEDKKQNFTLEEIKALIDQWLQQEADGVQFPVPFEIAWQIAGYSRKDNALRKLPKSSCGKLYHVDVEKPKRNSAGRPQQEISLSCDGLKHLGLKSNTEGGSLIRQIFTELEQTNPVNHAELSEVEDAPEAEDKKYNFTLEEIKALIDHWLEQEQNGVQFPVPFEIAWQIAGYSRKDNAKRRLISPNSRLIEDQDYKTDPHPQLFTQSLPQSLLQSEEELLSGSSSDSTVLSGDGFKHFCLLAQTEEGRFIRQYFIEAEKKWRLVQQTNPQLAQEIELQKLKNEALQLEAQKMTAENNLLQFRNTIVTTCPEPVQKKILGFDVIEKIEYRDRVISDQQMLRDGNTVTKSELCRRYGLFSKSGSPDYKELNRMLNSLNLPDSAYNDTYMIRENKELKREYLEQLDDLFNRSQQRSLFFGE